MKSRWRACRAVIFFVSFVVAALGLTGRAGAAVRPPLTYTNREPLWTFATKGAVVASPALSADGTTLYVASSDSRLYAIPTTQEDPSVTTSNWSLRLPAPIYSSPVIGSNGVIYVGCMNGWLYAITDQGDHGQIEWRHVTRGQIATSPVVGDDGTIYFGNSDNFLRALFPDGAIKWAFGASNNVATPVIAADGTILFVSGGYLYGVSESGAQVSSFTPASAIQSIPALAEDDTIYLGAKDNRVYALNPDSGTNAVRWRFNTGKDVSSSPAVGADGLVYIASDTSRIYCLTTNGALKWSVGTRAPVHSALSIGPDGTIYAGSEDTRMYAVSPQGKIVWTVKTRGTVRTSAAIDARGMIYFGSSDKKVYAVQGQAVVDFPESDEPVWQMFRKDQTHSARATLCTPFILQQPQTTNGLTEITITNAQSVTFSVIANAGAPVAYQWRLNGVDVDSTLNRSATNATFTLASVQSTDEGQYDVFVFNDCGEVESETFTLNVRSAPIITTPLTNHFLLAGNTLALNAGAIGSQPLAYQWFFNGAALPGATLATYAVTNVQPGASGRYYVTLSNAVGFVTSGTSTVSVFAVSLTLAEHPLGAGQRHSLAVLGNRTLWTWGLDNFGQLGNALKGASGTDLIFRNTPQLIGVGGTATTNAVWASVAGGSRSYDVAGNQPGGFSLGIQTNGSLWAWGLNDRGQLGINSGTSQNVPLRVGTDTNWSQVEAGSSHALALKLNGTIWAWGANNVGQLGLGSLSNSAVPVQVGTDSAWVEVRAGGFFSLARRADGTIWAWGANTNGQLGLGHNTNRSSPVMVGTNTDWAGISAGVFHSLGLKTDGSLWAWGRNNFGQLGLGTSGFGSESFNTNRPSQVGTAQDWRLVEAGRFDSFAIKDNGSLWAWGGNQLGQLGDGTIGSAGNTNDANKNVPVSVAPNQTWRAIDASSHTLGMTTDGNVWGWGWNSSGQVGDGTGGSGGNSNNRPLPVLLSFIPGTNSGTTNLVTTNAPSLSQQPANRVVNEGVALTSFSLVATGAPPLFYQWYFNSNVLAGNITSSNAFLILNAQHTNAGFYHAIITNAFGGTTSLVVTLTVTNTNGIVYLPGGGITTNGLVTQGPPVILQSPTNQSVGTNNGVSFSVTVVGAAPFIYQWRLNSNSILNTNATATTGRLTLTNVNAGDAGFYDVIVTNTQGGATSAVARLVVTNGAGLITVFKSVENWGGALQIGTVSITAEGFSVEVRHSGGKNTLVLEAKDALREPQWKPVSTNQNGATRLVDPTWTPQSTRFYRVRAE